MTWSARAVFAGGSYPSSDMKAPLRMNALTMFHVGRRISHYRELTVQCASTGCFDGNGAGRVLGYRTRPDIRAAGDERRAKRWDGAQ